MSDVLAHRRLTVCYFTAAPVDAPRLDGVKDEAFTIQSRLLTAGDHRRIEFHPMDKATPDRVISTISKESPDVVHFSLHGTEDGKLLFEDDYGRAKPVSGAWLLNVLSHLTRKPVLVVLNVCFTDVLAEEITRHSCFAVGMRQAIRGDAALGFAVTFYLNLADNKSLNQAYGLGCASASAVLESAGDTPARFATVEEDLNHPFLDVVAREKMVAPEVTSAPADATRRRSARRLGAFMAHAKAGIAALAAVVAVIAALVFWRRVPEVKPETIDSVVAVDSPSPWIVVCAIGADGGVRSIAPLRCIHWSDERTDDELREHARRSSASLVLRIDAHDSGRILLVDSKSGPQILARVPPIDLGHDVDRARLAKIIAPLAQLAAGKLRTDLLQCTPPSHDPPDSIDLLKLYLQLHSRTCVAEIASLDLSQLTGRCEGSAALAQSFECELARIVVLDVSPKDSTVAQDLLRSTDERVRYMASIKIASRACEQGNVEEAMSKLNELTRGDKSCGHLALVEVAACIKARSPRLADRPAEASRVAWIEALPALEWTQECDPPLRADALAGRGWWRLKTGMWSAAAEDYASADAVVHDPMYKLSRVEALLHLKELDEASRVMEKVNVDGPAKRTYKALLRWIIARELNARGLDEVAATLEKEYAALNDGARAIEDRSDTSLKTLACPMPVPSQCIFDLLAEPKSQTIVAQIHEVLRRKPTRRSDNPHPP
jgi:hypothetical protein